MKMRVLWICLLCVTAYSGMAQNRSINFEEGTFAEALEKAKTSNKLLFADFYTSWCGPCKMLARDVFTLNEVADYFNKHFISMKIDCEKGEGVELRQRFGVSAYPTLLFIDGKGNVVSKIVGAPTAENFLSKIKESLDPKNSLYAKEQRYKAGERDVDFMLDLIASYKSVREIERPTELSKELLSLVGEDKWVSKEMWDVISYFFVSPYGSMYWDFILKNAKEYEELVGKDAVVKKIGETMHIYLFRYAVVNVKADNKKVFDVAQKILRQYDIPNEETLQIFWNLGKCASFEDFDIYFQRVLDKIPELDIREHYRFFCNVIDYMKANMDEGQKEQFVKLMKDSQSKSNEYMAKAYTELFDRLK